MIVCSSSQCQTTAGCKCGASRPDLAPGFWPNYREPTPMAKAIQMPLHPLDRWCNGVLNAHILRPAALARTEDGGRNDG